MFPVLDEDDGFLQIKEEPCQCTECREFIVATLWNNPVKPIKRRYKCRCGKPNTIKRKPTIVQIICLPKKRKKKWFTRRLSVFYMWQFIYPPMGFK